LPGCTVRGGGLEEFVQFCEVDLGLKRVTAMGGGEGSVSGGGEGGM
jgi:hypothetical protein